MKKILSFVAAALLAVPATFAQGFVSQGGDLMPLELIDGDTMTCSGTVEITPYVPFTFVVDLGEMGGQMTFGPEEDVYLDFEQSTEAATGSIEMMGSGVFYLTSPMAITPLEITFNAFGSQTTYSIKLGDSGNVMDPVFVTFNFTGIADGWKALTLPKDLEGPTYTTQIANPGSQIYFQIPEDSYYEITGMEVTNRDEDEIDDKVALDNLGDAWQAAIYYDQSFNGMEIDVNIVGKNNVTFNFTGIEDAYQAVTAFDMLSENEIIISSNPYVLNYGPQAQIMLGAKEGYTIEVSGPEYDGDPENAPYQIIPMAPMDPEDSIQYAVWVTPAADDFTFDVTVEAIAEPNAVTFNFTGVENAYEHVNAYDVEGGVVTLASNSYKFEYEEMGILALSAKEGYKISIEGPAYEGEIPPYGIFSQDMDDVISYTVGCYPAANGMVFTVTVEEVATPNAVTFNFTGIENAYQYVNVYDVEGGVVTLAGNTYKFEYQEMGILALSAKEGYKISIEGPAYEGENPPYAIFSQDMDDVISYTVGCYPAANGMVFTVTVEEVATPNAVTFNFTGVENAYEHVNAYDVEGGVVTLASNSYKFEYEEMGILALSAKEGYKISIEGPAYEGENPPYAIFSQDMDDVISYTVGCYPAANGMVFTVTVEEVATPNAVTFNFTGVENAYQYVNAYDVEGGVVTLASNTYKFEYEEMGILALSAKEGYKISIEGPAYEGENPPYAIYSQDMDDVISYTVGCYPAADGMVFTVTVSVDPSSSVRSILNGESDATIYDLNGRKVNANKLGNGLYIINGKKVMIRK